EAFSQLFLSDHLSGSFVFSSSERALSEWAESERITPNPEEMLIHALQGRDELTQLKRRLCENARLRRKKTSFSWPSSAWEELKAHQKALLQAQRASLKKLPATPPISEPQISTSVEAVSDQ